MPERVRPMRWPWSRKPKAPVESACRCGHPESKHGFMGHPDCTDGEGDFFCLCERFEVAR